MREISDENNYFVVFRAAFNMSFSQKPGRQINGVSDASSILKRVEILLLWTIYFLNGKKDFESSFLEVHQAII